MTNYLSEFRLCDSTPDRIIESGRYWADEEVFSSFKLTSAYDPSHYFTFDVNRGSENAGWTMFSTPSTFQVKAGSKTPSSSGAINLFADNGDVNITCMNGDIRLKARNIHIEAGLNVTDNRNGSVHITGSEKVSIHAPTVDLEAKRMLRLVSAGNGVLNVPNIFEMGVGMCKAFSNSSSGGSLLGIASLDTIPSFVK